MSKLAICFDAHAWNFRRHGGQSTKGINRRGALCLDALRRAIDVANANNAPLIVAGDLIDSAGPVQPQFAEALRFTLSRNKHSVYLVLGNHDMTSEGDHSLGIYECNRPTRAVERINFVHSQTFPPKAIACLVPFNCDIRDERVRDVPLLVAHFGIYDDSFPPWLKRSKGAWHVDALFAFMRERNIKCALLGDWHQRAIWVYDDFLGQHLPGLPPPRTIELESTHRTIMQGGALCSTGFDNSGLRGYGTVALWDEEAQSLSWQELSGPRFCVARSDAEEQSIIAEAKRLGHNLFLRRYYSSERPPTPEGLEAYEALPVRVEQAAEIAVCDQSFTQKDQLQALVSKWLDECGDEREALEAHVRRYL